MSEDQGLERMNYQNRLKKNRETMNKEKKTRKSRFPKSGIGYRKIQEVFKAYGLQQITYKELLELIKDLGYVGETATLLVKHKVLMPIGNSTYWIDIYNRRGFKKVAYIRKHYLVSMRYRKITPISPNAPVYLKIWGSIKLFFNTL